MSSFYCTIRRYEFSIECHMDRTVLESEGIATQIRNDHLLSINPLLAYACGGVQLRVKQRDLERAWLLLNEKNSQDWEACCPRCHSKDLIYNWKRLRTFAQWLSFIVCLNFLVYPFHIDFVTRCNKCKLHFTFAP